MLTRNDLVVLEESMVSDLIAHTPALADAFQYGVRTTSGTSGSPLMTVMQYPPRVFKRYEGSERIVFCSGSLSLRLTRALQLRHHTNTHRIVCIDAHDLSSSLAEHLRDFDPDMVEGVPSFIVRVGEYVSTITSVHKLVLFGERLIATVEAFLQKTFPHAEIRTLYLSTEMGQIGSSCPHLPSRNFYHPASDVRLKVMNADDTGAGELLVSKRVGSKEYVEDYLIGDTVRMKPGICKCGEKISFEHLGRGGYDYIKVAGAIVRREEFDRVAALFAQFIDDYRAEVGEKLIDGKIKGSIVLRVFRKKGAVTPGLCREIARDFSRAVFLTPTQTYSDLVGRELFTQLVVEFSSTPFLQKHKDVKLVRV